jgi:hypothetical protein
MHSYSWAIIIGEENTKLKYIVEVCEPQAISYQPSAKTNAVQASHPDRIGFALRSVTLVHARGMGESISHALREALSSMHSADRHLRSELRKVDPQHHGGRQPLLPWGRTCEEAATPGQPVARRSAFPVDPSRQFTLENHRAPPALPQCSGRARRTSRLMSALSPAPMFAASKNPGPFVQKLWMPAIPCGCSWKIWK